MRTPASPNIPFTLVGRDRELGVLREHLDAALTGRGSLVLIGGEAGLGKTALAEALCREATAQGALVLIGHCYDLTETPPYGPWIELFGRYRQLDGNPLGRMPPLPAPFAQRGTIGRVASQAVLFQEVVDFLIAVAVRRSLVLLLEDLHWADPASLDLLRFVARTLSDHPLLVLAVYRGDEITRHHPLFALLPLLVRESGAVRTGVARLTDDAVRALVATHYPLPRTDEQRLVTYLQKRAEGNALFVGELLRSLEEQGALRRDHDGWAFRYTRHVRVPPLLKQVIGGRVARLGEEARGLLGVAAIVGQEVPFDLWATVGGVDEDALSAVVERAAEAHLMEETPDGTRSRFTHALIRETLFEEILPSRRRRLHRRVAEALERLPAPDFDALAYHYHQAGNERAERWLVVAGVRAQYAGAVRTASERFEAAFRLLAARGGPAAERGWLLCYLARMAVASDPQRSLSLLDEAVRVTAAVEDPALTATMARNRGNLWCNVGQVRAGIEETLRGEALGQDIQVEKRPWLQGFPSPPTVAGELTFHAISSQGVGQRSLGSRSRGGWSRHVGVERRSFPLRRCGRHNSRR